MKNFIILILAVALGIVSYLHFVKEKTIEPTPIIKNTKIIELGKDSIKLSFYVDERLDSTNTEKPLEGETKSTKQAASLTFATTPCIAETSRDCPDLFAVICCHLPPPNVIPTFNQRLSIFNKDIVKGLKVEVIKGR